MNNGINLPPFRGNEIADEIMQNISLESSLMLIKFLNPKLTSENGMWCYTYGSESGGLFIKGIGATVYFAMLEFEKAFKTVEVSKAFKTTPENPKIKDFINFNDPEISEGVYKIYRHIPITDFKEDKWNVLDITTLVKILEKTNHSSGVSAPGYLSNLYKEWKGSGVTHHIFNIEIKVGILFADVIFVDTEAGRFAFKELLNGKSFCLRGLIESNGIFKDLIALYGWDIGTDNGIEYLDTEKKKYR